MNKGDLVFIDKNLTKDEKLGICDEVIYLIDLLLAEDPREINLRDFSHRFRIDTLRSKVKALKKQIS
mgnify:CR=1 FL=1